MSCSRVVYSHTVEEFLNVGNRIVWNDNGYYQLLGKHRGSVRYGNRTYHADSDREILALHFSVIELSVIQGYMEGIEINYIDTEIRKIRKIVNETGSYNQMTPRAVESRIKWLLDKQGG
jgi:tryptophanase